MSDALLHTPRRPRYLALALTAFQQAAAYRVTTLVSIVTSFVWVFILYFVWEAAFSGSRSIAGYSWADMRTYVVVGFGINALVGWRVGSAMMATIKTGEIVIDVVRPLNYCGTQVARAVGFSVVEGGFSLALTVLVGALVLDVQLPASPLAAAGFVAAFAMGYLTKVLIVFGVSLLSFWVLNSAGLMWAQQAVIMLGSGVLIPLALMPDPLRGVVEVLPLRGIVATPLALYLGRATGWEAVGLLALQAGWLLALWLLANWAWRRAFRAVEVQGG